MKVIDGGPAFPITSSAEAHKIALAATIGIDGTTKKDDAYTVAYSRCLSGMSLRDYFAGMALQGYLAGRNINALDCSFYTCERVAKNCYGYAEAMLAARERKEDA